MFSDVVMYLVFDVGDYCPPLPAVNHLEVLNRTDNKVTVECSEGFRFPSEDKVKVIHCDNYLWEIGNSELCEGMNDRKASLTIDCIRF